MAGDLMVLSNNRKIHAICKKQYVYFEGDDPIRLYFLRSGRVKTLRTEPNGKEFITGLYHAGDFLVISPYSKPRNTLTLPSRSTIRNWFTFRRMTSGS